MHAGDAEKAAAMPVLLQLVGDSPHDIRLQAIAALGLSKTAAAKAIPALAALAKDPDPSVRQRALLVLRKMGPNARKGALPGLTAALEDKDITVRLPALLLLGQLGAMNAKTATTVLMEALQSPQAQIRMEAAPIVAHHGLPGKRRPPSARPPLERP